jgi:HEAT repeat protein
MTAAQALGQMTDEGATRALVKALDDPDYVVVIEALKGLAVQRAVEAIPAIEKRHGKARKAEDLRIERACEAAVKAIREQP